MNIDNIKFEVLPIQMVSIRGHLADAVLTCLPPEDLSEPPYSLPVEPLKNHTWIPCMDVGFMETNVNQEYIDVWKECVDERFLPTKEHVKIALEWGRQIQRISVDKKNFHAIVHCHAGASRSPAFLYIILCDLMSDEQDAYKKLMQITPGCVPNPYIVSIADKYMKRHGRMKKIIDEHTIEKMKS